MTDRRSAKPGQTDRDLPIMLPDLPTAVALAGTVHRAEVGGNVCFNTIITIAIVSGGG